MTTDDFVEMHGFVVDHTSPEGFVFNVHSVCLNPERIEIYDGKKYSLTIKVCCYQGFWDYGYEFTSRHGSFTGSSGPCDHPGPSPYDQKHFPERRYGNRTYYYSREEAIKSGLDHAERFVDRIKKYHPIPEQAKVYAAITSARTPQLTLF